MASNRAATFHTGFALSQRTCACVHALVRMCGLSLPPQPTALMGDPSSKYAPVRPSVHMSVCACERACVHKVHRALSSRFQELPRPLSSYAPAARCVRAQGRWGVG